MNVLNDNSLLPQFDETYEKDRRDKYWLVRKGDIVIDIGASQGPWTIDALQKGAKYVYAFEPNQNDYNYLRTETLPFNLKCTISQVALWSFDGEIPFNETLRSFIFKVDENSPKHTVSKLDTYFSRYKPSKVDWVKIDTEGAEAEILNGGEWFFKHYSPTIIIETHNDCIDIISLVIRLQAYGYNIKQERLNNLQDIVIAKKS